MLGESTFNVKTDLFLDLEVINCAFLKVEGIREIASVEVPIRILDVLPADAHEKRP